MLLPILSLLVSDMPVAKSVEARYTKAYKTCMTTGDAAKGIQPAMNGCAGLEAERQDKVLNATYARVMSRLNKAAQAKLRISERAWIKKSNKTCIEEEAEYKGGSMAPLIWYTCLTNQRIERTIWLEKYRG